MSTIGHGEYNRRGNHTSPNKRHTMTFINLSNAMSLKLPVHLRDGKTRPDVLRFYFAIFKCLEHDYSICGQSVIQISGYPMGLCLKAAQGENTHSTRPKRTNFFFHHLLFACMVVLRLKVGTTWVRRRNQRRNQHPTNRNQHVLGRERFGRAAEGDRTPLTSNARLLPWLVVRGAAM